MIRQEEYDLLCEAMEQTIASSHLFKSLDHQARQEVLQCGYVVSFAAGDTVVQQGDPGHAMYLILSGSVRVEADTSSGRMILAELGPSACVGEVSVLSGSPRTASVIAAIDTDLVAFEKHRIKRVLDEHPKVRSLLESLIEGRARDMLEKFVQS